MWSVVVRIVCAVILVGGVLLWYRLPDRADGGARHDTAAELEYVIQEDASSDPEETRVAVVPQASTLDRPTAVMRAPQETPQDFFATLRDNAKQSVPFVVQAPRAQWHDPRYQDACEEASMLMAHAWLSGDGVISKSDAEAEMERMFAAQQERFGDDVVDTSVIDTADLFQSYFHMDVEVARDITLENIYRNLAEGAIIIAPTNGRALGNPNFTNGGPDRHMVVIIGYDKDARELITNDPGTRVGKGYRYKDTVLYNAIRDYSTGHKKPIRGTFKNVIIVRK